MPQYRINHLILPIVIFVVYMLSSDKFALAAIGSTSNRSKQQLTCTFEIDNANKTTNPQIHSLDTVTNWPITVRQMISQSSMEKSVQSEMTKELNKIQLLADKFGANINKKPIERQVKDLVELRRMSNRLALSIYLKTFDMRLPQSSVQLGVAVERVQQACLSNLDRAAMLVLNSPIEAEMTA